VSVILFWSEMDDARLDCGHFTSDKIHFTSDKIHFTSDKIHFTSDKIHFTMEEMVRMIIQSAHTIILSSKRLHLHIFNLKYPTYQCSPGVHQIFIRY